MQTHGINDWMEATGGVRTEVAHRAAELRRDREQRVRRGCLAQKALTIEDSR